MLTIRIRSRFIFSKRCYFIGLVHKLHELIIVYDCLPTTWQFLYPTPEEVRWFGCEEFTKPVLKRDVIIGDSSKIVRWRAEDLEDKVDIE